MRTTIALLVTVLVLAVLALIWDSYDSQPAREVEVVASAQEANSTATTWLETQPDLGAGFGDLVRALRPKPKARTAPTRAALFSAAYAYDVQAVIRDTFSRFGSAVVQEALRVAQCESGFVPTARNGVHVGIFQLSGTYHRARAARLGFDWSRMVEAGPNAAVAADIYSESKWGPWQCKP